MAGWKQTITLAIALAVVILAAIVGSHFWLSLPFLAIAVLLFAWGLEPQRTEEFVGDLPCGKYVLQALAKLNSMLPYY